MGKTTGVWTVILLALLAVVQYWLWFSPGGIPDLQQRKAAILTQQAENQRLEACNRLLRAEVIDLKSGEDALEERARNDLGMIFPDEIYLYLSSDEENAQSDPNRMPEGCENLHESLQESR